MIFLIWKFQTYLNVGRSILLRFNFYQECTVLFVILLFLHSEKHIWLLHSSGCIASEVVPRTECGIVYFAHVPVLPLATVNNFIKGGINVCYLDGIIVVPAK